MPVVAFRLKTVTGSDGAQHRRLYDEFALADRLRMRGWVLPGKGGPGWAGTQFVSCRLAATTLHSPLWAAAGGFPVWPCSRWIDVRDHGYMGRNFTSLLLRTTPHLQPTPCPPTLSTSS